MVKIVMHGKVKGFEGKGPLIAATDASYKARTAGIAYVISDGRWGLRQWAAQPRLDPTGPSRVLIAELRAVALLVEAPAGPRAAGLLVDSVNAIKYLRAWQAGDAQRMPDVGGTPPRCRHSPGSLRSWQPTRTCCSSTFLLTPAIRSTKPWTR